MYTLMNFTTLNYLKENIDENFNSYYNSDNTEILKNIDEQFEKNSILIISDKVDLSKDDLENAISLYEYYKFLPVSLASEERFWTYLTHTLFWEYMCKRWPVSSSQKNKIEFIKTRYFFNSKSKNFYRNGLSRLWWLAHITYDSTNEDQYYYTRIAFTSQDLANLIMDTPRLSRNIKALKAVLKNILRLEQLEELQEIHKIKNKRDFLRDIAKYVNLVGGVTIWDKLSEEEAYDIIKKFLDKKLNYIVKTN